MQRIQLFLILVLQRLVCRAVQPGPAALVSSCLSLFPHVDDLGMGMGNAGLTLAW